MTATPLPPLPDHAGRVTPSGVFTFVGLSLMGGGKVYTAAQMQAYATQARADLEAENARLREALKSLAEAAPTSLRCEDFHHPARDRHGIGGHCGPKARYVTALNSAIAALENTK